MNDEQPTPNPEGVILTREQVNAAADADDRELERISQLPADQRKAALAALDAELHSKDLAFMDETGETPEQQATFDAIENEDLDNLEAEQQADELARMKRLGETPEQKAAFDASELADLLEKDKKQVQALEALAQSDTLPAELPADNADTTPPAEPEPAIQSEAAPNSSEVDQCRADLDQINEDPENFLKLSKEQAAEIYDRLIVNIAKGGVVEQSQLEALSPKVTKDFYLYILDKQKKSTLESDDLEALVLLDILSDEDKSGAKKGIRDYELTAEDQKSLTPEEISQDNAAKNSIDLAINVIYGNKKLDAIEDEKLRGEVKKLLEKMGYPQEETAPAPTPTTAPTTEQSGDVKEILKKYKVGFWDVIKKRFSDVKEGFKALGETIKREGILKVIGQGLRESAAMTIRALKAITPSANAKEWFGFVFGGTTSFAGSVAGNYLSGGKWGSAGFFGFAELFNQGNPKRIYENIKSSYVREKMSIALERAASDQESTEILNREKQKLEEKMAADSQERVAYWASHDFGRGFMKGMKAGAIAATLVDVFGGTDKLVNAVTGKFKTVSAVPTPVEPGNEPIDYNKLKDFPTRKDMTPGIDNNPTPPGPQIKSPFSGTDPDNTPLGPNANIERPDFSAAAPDVAKEALQGNLTQVVHIDTNPYSWLKARIGNSFPDNEGITNLQKHLFAHFNKGVDPKLISPTQDIIMPSDSLIQRIATEAQAAIDKIARQGKFFEELTPREQLLVTGYRGAPLNAEIGEKILNLYK